MEVDDVAATTREEGEAQARPGREAVSAPQPPPTPGIARAALPPQHRTRVPPAIPKNAIPPTQPHTAAPAPQLPAAPRGASQPPESPPNGYPALKGPQRTAPQPVVSPAAAAAAPPAAPTSPPPPAPRPLAGLKLLLHSSVPHLTPLRLGLLRRRLVEQLGAAAVVTELAPGRPQQITHVVLGAEALGLQVGAPGAETGGQQQQSSASTSHTYSYTSVISGASSVSTSAGEQLRRRRQEAVEELAQELRPALDAIRLAHTRKQQDDEVKQKQREQQGQQEQEQQQEWPDGRMRTSVAGRAPQPPAAAPHPALTLDPRLLAQSMRVVDSGWLEEVLRTGRRAPAAPYVVPYVYELLARRVWGWRGPPAPAAGPGAATATTRAAAGAAGAATSGRDGGGSSGDERPSDGGSTGLVEATAAAAAAKAAAVARGIAPGAGAGGSPQEGIARRRAVPRSLGPLEAGSGPAPNAPLGRFARWLGHWDPSLDHVTRASELVMHGLYDKARCTAVGNGHVWRALRELTKYEEALAGPRDNTNVHSPRRPGQPLPRSPATAAPSRPRSRAGGLSAVGGWAGDDEQQPLINHQALNYAHAAAVVCACSFRITPDMSPKQLQQALPYFGPFTARVVHEIAVRGSSEQLDAFWEDQAVRDSSGKLRLGTEGASARRAFCTLPGVGPVLGRHWWDSGLRSLDQVEAAGAAARRAAGLPLHGDLEAAAMEPAAAAATGRGGAAASGGGGESGVDGVKGVEGDDTDGEEGDGEGKGTDEEEGAGRGGKRRRSVSRSEELRRAHSRRHHAAAMSVAGRRAAANGQAVSEALAERRRALLAAADGDSGGKEVGGSRMPGDGRAREDARAVSSGGGGSRGTARGSNVTVEGLWTAGSGGAGSSSYRGESWWRGEVWYSVVWRGQLAEDVQAHEVQHMRQEVLEGLRLVSGDADWVLLQVGGGRRSGAQGDADFLATHPNRRGEGSTAALVRPLYELLVARGRVVPLEQGFCRLQAGHLPGFLPAMRDHVATGRWTGDEQMDRYDHLWVLWVTPQGRRRRLDVMLVPYSEMWPYAVMGWTGSKQYLRFMRQHALNNGLFTNSHATMRKTRQGARVVPTEALPALLPGSACLPAVPGGEGAGGASTSAAAGAGAGAGGARGRRRERGGEAGAGAGTALGGGGEPVEFVPQGWNQRGGQLELCVEMEGEEDEAEGGVGEAGEMRGVGETGLRPVASELDIFELLGLPYRPPHQRDA